MCHSLSSATGNMTNLPCSGCPHSTAAHDRLILETSFSIIFLLSRTWPKFQVVRICQRNFFFSRSLPYFVEQDNTDKAICHGKWWSACILHGTTACREYTCPLKQYWYSLLLEQESKRSAFMSVVSRVMRWLCRTRRNSLYVLGCGHTSIRVHAPALKSAGLRNAHYNYNTDSTQSLSNTNHLFFINSWLPPRASHGLQNQTVSILPDLNCFSPVKSAKVQFPTCNDYKILVPVQLKQPVLLAFCDCKDQKRTHSTIYRLSYLFLDHCSITWRQN